MINILGLCFLILGPWGIAITGGLQVLDSLFYLIVFPKDKLIYSYLIVVGIFFLVWDYQFNWMFSIPILLMIFLTYIIHFQKTQKL